MATKPAAQLWSDLPIAPGELLKEELAAIGMTQQEFAARTGRPSQVINEIIRDKKRITQDTALDFEKALGIPARFWLHLETDYQLTRARLRDDSELRKQEQWLDQFPLREMERRGWIDRFPEKSTKVRAVLAFLGVASFDAWQRTQLVTGFRVTAAANISAGALAVWLRKGELDGRAVATGTYDEGRFRSSLSTVRGLTTELPEVFLPRMVDECANAGVAVVLTPELPKSGAHGSARWLSSDTALIQLSIRYKTNDQFWFSFFHEACHILRHRVRQIFVDGIREDDGAEEEANAFARDFLIPPAAWAEFVDTEPRSFAAAVAFADKVGIAPGIVVGRLQREGVIPYTNLNSLKVRFTWTPPVKRVGPTRKAGSGG